MTRRLIYVCNALHDATRHRREISSDSPATSRKALSICAALRKVGVRAIVLSMGRGKADNSWRYHAAEFQVVNGVPIIYLPFLRVRLISEIVSMVALVYRINFLRRRKGRTTFMFENRTAAYIPALVLTAALRMRRILDLEDGNTGQQEWSLSSAPTRLKTILFRSLCTEGTLLANTALGNQDVIGPRMCFYGVSSTQLKHHDWTAPTINLLLGGTISIETGADLLWNAVQEIRRANEHRNERLHFVVTGRGDYLDAFRLLEDAPGAPSVSVMGRLDDAQYDELLESTHVGLALKPNSGALADTTFPSKVVEMAGAGLLVVTTNISDVRSVLGDGAVYLHDDEPSSLIEIIRWVSEHPQEAECIAQRGTQRVRSLCDSDRAGALLSDFLFE